MQMLMKLVYLIILNTLMMRKIQKQQPVLLMRIIQNILANHNDYLLRDTSIVPTNFKNNYFDFTCISLVNSSWRI